MKKDLCALIRLVVVVVYITVTVKVAKGAYKVIPVKNGTLEMQYTKVRTQFEPQQII